MVLKKYLGCLPCENLEPIRLWPKTIRQYLKPHSRSSKSRYLLPTSSLNRFGDISQQPWFVHAPASFMKSLLAPERLSKGKQGRGWAVVGSAPSGGERSSGPWALVVTTRPGMLDALTTLSPGILADGLEPGIKLGIMNCAKYDKASPADYAAFEARALKRRKEEVPRKRPRPDTDDEAESEPTTTRPTPTKPTARTTASSSGGTRRAAPERRPKGTPPRDDGGQAPKCEVVVVDLDDESEEGEGEGEGDDEAKATLSSAVGARCRGRIEPSWEIALETRLYTIL